MRQKKEKYNEIFKRSKLIERSPREINQERRKGKLNGTKELIIVLKELKN